VEAWTFALAAACALAVALLTAARRPAWIVAHPRSVLVGVALASLAALAVLVSPSPFGLRLEIDPSSDPLLPTGDPARAAYGRAVLEFGDDEVYVVALEVDDIFTAENLGALRRITHEIARIDGVRAVKSLADVVSFRYDRDNDWVDVGPFLDEVPTAPSELGSLRERAIGDPIYARSIVSPDGRVAAVNVSFHDMSDREFIEGRYDVRIREILEREAVDGRRFYVAGRPHVKSRVYDMMIHDLSRLIPAAIAVIAGILALVAGSLRMVVLPLGMVAVTTLWTFAAVSLLDRPLTVLTTLLAPVLIAIGSAYGVHVLTRYEGELAAGGNLRARVSRCLEAMSTPVLISGLTTSIGFAALLLTDVPAVFELGSFAIFGVLSLTALSLTALPAALLAMPRLAGNAPPPASTRIFRRGMAVSLEALARLTTRSPTAVIAVWGVVTLGAAAAIPRVVIDTDYLSYFPERSSVRRDFEAINHLLSGAVPIYVVWSGSEAGAFRDPQVLAAIERVQTRLDETTGVSRTLSMVDFIRVIHRVFREDDPAAERIPDTRSGVSDLIFLIPKHDLARFSNVNQSRANILVRTGEVGSAAIQDLVGRIEAVLAEHPLPVGVSVDVTGNTILLSRSADGVASGQPRSVSAAAIAIFVLVSLALGTPRIGAVAMIPNVAPVILFFGLLGWGVAPLSLPTSLIACVALGIAVDATAHYLVHYRAERDRGADPPEAVRLTHRAVGPPIVVASVTLCFGFAVVAFSEFATLRQFGLLSSLTLAICMATDLVLLPAVLARGRL
jgi:predicted RND superfamily exporter protein